MGPRPRRSRDPRGPREGPAVRAHPADPGPDRFLWLLRAHHLLLDGYGYKLLGRRLAETYNALAEGREPAPCGFAPVSRLQAEEAAYRASERYARDRDHWAQAPERPAGARRLTLPYGRPHRALPAPHRRADDPPRPMPSTPRRPASASGAPTC
ncbi:hypothetical protein GCM10023238_29980 [Streptomyces heliomycini]